MIRVIRILLKTLAVTIAACLSLVLLAYYVIVAVNWNDREPTALAQQWRQQYDDRAAVADAENAYVFAMAFAVPARQDPTERVSGRRVARAVPAAPALSIMEMRPTIAGSPRKTGCCRAISS